MKGMNTSEKEQFYVLIFNKLVKISENMFYFKSIDLSIDRWLKNSIFIHLKCEKSESNTFWSNKSPYSLSPSLSLVQSLAI